MTDTNEEKKEEKYTLDILKKDLTNIKSWPANILSLSRIPAIAIVPHLVSIGDLLLVLLAAGAFALTDCADGVVARLLKATTETGKMLDPIADKIMAIGLMLQLLPTMPYMAVPLFFEYKIAKINSLSLKNGGKPASNKNGKRKMWPLSAAMVFGYSAMTTDGALANVFAVLTFAATAATIPFQLKNIKEYKAAAINNTSTDNNHTKASNNNQLGKEKQIEEITSIQMLNDIKAELEARTHGYGSNQNEIDLLKLTRDELTWSPTPPKTADKVRVFKQN